MIEIEIYSLIKKWKENGAAILTDEEIDILIDTAQYLKALN